MSGPIVLIFSTLDDGKLSLTVIVQAIVLMALLAANTNRGLITYSDKVPRGNDVSQYPSKDNLFSKIVSGQLPIPPAAKFLGAQIERAEHGSIDFSFRADPSFLNAVGHVQGGMLSAMLDEALGVAALLVLDAGQYVVTLETNVQFIKAAVAGELKARGRLVSRTSRIAFTDAELTQDGKLVARGTATIMIKTLPQS